MEPVYFEETIKEMWARTFGAVLGISGRFFFFFLSGLFSFGVFSKIKMKVEDLVVTSKDEVTHVKEVSLSFSNLTFATTKGKQILSDCSGVVQAGELCAVLGPSGSGKTCLLDILAHRRKKGGLLVRGAVRFNGKQLMGVERRKLVSYIGQEDVLLGNFSVRETINFAIYFVHGVWGLDPEALRAKADRILLDVGLYTAADTIVGGGGKGISGGQRRRLRLVFG